MNIVKQTIVHIDRVNCTVMVESSKGNRYPVTPTADMEYHIQHRSVILGDYAHVIKSPVTKEWVMTDFSINTDMYDDYDNPGCDTSTNDVDVEPDYMITLEEYL